MGEELKRLKQKPTEPGEKRKNHYGLKKAYFLENLDDILELSRTPGITYRDIIDAIAREGVKLSYDYFRELMNEFAPEDKTPIATKQTESINAAPSSLQAAKQAASDIADISPEKAALKAEIERIKTLNISSKEKREMMAKATEAFAKTQNPLDRK